MRILKQKNINKEIVLDKSTIFNLVIENPRYYRDCINKITCQLNSEEEYFLYYDNDKEEDLSKCSFIIPNPLNIEIDEKKINTLIQKDISGKMNISNKEEYQLLLNTINEYISKISYDYPLPLTFDTELTLQSFLKSISLQVYDDYPDYLQYLISQIKKISIVLKLNLFFIVNLHDYLTEEEMNSFVKEMNSLELSFVLISSHLPLAKSEDEFIIRIDNDLCELHLESKTVKD